MNKYTVKSKYEGEDLVIEAERHTFETNGIFFWVGTKHPVVVAYVPYDSIVAFLNPHGLKEENNE